MEHKLDRPPSYNSYVLKAHLSADSGGSSGGAESPRDKPRRSLAESQKPNGIRSIHQVAQDVVASPSGDRAYSPSQADAPKFNVSNNSRKSYSKSAASQSSDRMSPHSIRSDLDGFKSSANGNRKSSRSYSSQVGSGPRNRRFRSMSEEERKRSEKEFKTPLSVGIGVYDITGPCVEVGMNGYSRPEQVSEGIHMRLFARAFIFVQRVTKERACIVNVDLAFVQLDVRREVLRLLNDHFDEMKETSPYTETNLMIAANNTHSSVGGASHYLMYNMSSGGFCEENWRAVTEGISRAVIRAHESIIPNAKIFFGEKKLEKTNINRSSNAYNKNPRSEREKYDDNVEKTMSVIRITDFEEFDIGALSFFPVHANSFTYRRKLVSGDNKGLAEYFFEKKVNGKRYIPGTRGFLAASFQT
jgi:hypothetical protein